MKKIRFVEVDNEYLVQTKILFWWKYFRLTTSLNSEGLPKNTIQRYKTKGQALKEFMKFGNMKKQDILIYPSLEIKHINI
jgi:hypothetical protein